MATKHFVLHPLSPKSKIPTTKDYPNLTQSVPIPTGCNTGLVTGNASNVMVIDLDNLLYEDIFCLNEFPTLQSRHRDGKKHLFYEWNPRLQSLASNFTGIEILTDGRNVCIPPSIHPSGEKYEWYPNEFTPIIPMPAKVEKALEEVINTRSSLTGLLSVSRTCLRNLLTKTPKPIVHGENGRKLMLMICTDLLKAGASNAELHMMARFLYESEYDYGITAREIKNLNAERTWKCSTIKDCNPVWCEGCIKPQIEFTPVHFSYQGITAESIIGMEEAKHVLEIELSLRANQMMAQHFILLEGPPGTGKSSVAQAMIKLFMEKYPETFHFSTLDYSSDIGHIKEKIHAFFDVLRDVSKHKKIIIFVDECEAQFPSRKKTGGFIHGEKCHQLIIELNNEIPNLLIIACTNRPDNMDSAILDRCINRIHCAMPTQQQIVEMVSYHLSFLSEEYRNILCDAIFASAFSTEYNGRDIFHLSQMLKRLKSYKELSCENYIITYEDIKNELNFIESAKLNLQADYTEKKKGKK